MVWDRILFCNIILNLPLEKISPPDKMHKQFSHDV